MEELQRTVALGIAASFLAILIASATNKVVIYFNFSDLIISIMPLGSMIIAVIVMAIYGPNNEFNFDPLLAMVLSIYTTTQTLVAYIGAGGIYSIFSVEYVPEREIQ